MKNLFKFLLIFLFPFTLAAQEQFSIYFDSNKYELKKGEQERLDAWMLNNKESKILAINGYTDEDGTTGLNDTLAQRRVSTVFGILKGKIATREDFRIRSFGELHKQSSKKAENRKVTVYYIEKKDLARENEILGIKVVKPVAPVAKGPKVYPDKISVMGPNGKETELTLDVAFMKRVGEAKTGEKIKIENLNFYENTFGVMVESRHRLYELLQVMEANPKLKIKLLGHVCCMKADRNDLSTQRAKAVMMFLNQSGIEKSRLSFQGFGVSQPIYTIPEKNADEREANRRVEVMIVENP
ncbi:cell envelope biogenesis protein OmpA [Flavobacterium rivuli WB 3.3-2 = DSM 21788]|uniref:Cell envelope biogenesis protein OmpA n=1 Tax=Flavobacterium rivuli WB 3.3-2 = DSM 21788 TaxID=1121895 RepID=A0A0A2MJN8_9FLAO|nr:OmpA family protein [Flavobacterium rivuli]KGO88540.1 cell envelope biogenesis protein OmpA [Flavobacterium rivuli WB 3.3-2 = DSM 21788]